MRIQYDPTVDALYIAFKPGRRVDGTLEAGAGVNVDVDSRGNPIGIEILYALRRLGRESLTTLGIDLSGLEWYSKEDRLMSTVQAAKALGVSRQYVTKIVREGKVKGRRVGRGWLISQSTLEQFKRRRHASTAQESLASVR